MWRIGGLVLLAGIALMLVAVLAKFMILAGATILLIRVIAGQAMRLWGSGPGQTRALQPQILSIDGNGADESFGPMGEHWDRPGQPWRRSGQTASARYGAGWAHQSGQIISIQ
ncbi:hypothetical protein GCM10027578_22680 [Spirosoma luteolum]